MKDLHPAREVERIRGAFRHPALHVALLGSIVALAVLVARDPEVDNGQRRVFITGADLLQLQASFMRTWQREPTLPELRGALDKHIRQEVLYREALARGYDRDDPVVRMAMERKMEFLASAQVAQAPPTDQDVEAFRSCSIAPSATCFKRPANETRAPGTGGPRGRLPVGQPGARRHRLPGAPGHLGVGARDLRCPVHPAHRRRPQAAR